LDFIVNILREGFSGSIESVYSIARVVIPLMIVMELLKELKVLDKISELFKPVTGFLGISKKGAFPIIVGLFLGLAFGAGIIIKSAKEGELSKRDLFLIIVFLVACHSVIEDTLIFVAVGANGWLLLGMRILVAVILTILISKYINKSFIIKKILYKKGI
jgi:hypothetical protein